MSCLNSCAVENVKAALNEKLEEFIKDVVSREAPYFSERTEEEIVQDFCEYANKW